MHINSMLVAMLIVPPSGTTDAPGVGLRKVNTNHHSSLTMISYIFQWTLLLLVYCTLTKSWLHLRPIHMKLARSKTSLKLVSRYTLPVPSSYAKIPTGMVGDPNMLLNQHSTSLHSLLFDGTMSSGVGRLTIDVLADWERRLDASTTELRTKKEKSEVLSTYQSMLASAASKELNPLQSTAFKVLASAAVDTLLALYPKDTSITSLIEEVTDVHFNIINELFDNRDKERSENDDL
jgi:hypothetical protein